MRSSGLPAERHGHAVYDEAREDLCDDGHPALAHDETCEVVLARRAHLPRREERAAVEALGTSNKIKGEGSGGAHLHLVRAHFPLVVAPVLAAEVPRSG